MVEYDGHDKPNKKPKGLVNLNKNNARNSGGGGNNGSTDLVSTKGGQTYSNLNSFVLNYCLLIPESFYDCTWLFYSSESIYF